MRNTFKKFMPIAMFALVLVFVFANQSFAAESFTDFSLSAEGGVKANYDGDKLLTITGSGDIEYNKWAELRVIFGTKREGSPLYNQKDFKVKFIADDGYKIGLCNTVEDRGMFEGFRCSLDFNNSVDVSKLTNTSKMFQSAINFTGDLSDWDVSNVIDMHRMFEGAYKFNSDLSKWDVSKVENFESMFYEAKEFNSDLSNWNTSSAVDMNSMFSCTKKFNSDLNKWDISKVNTIANMFEEAKAFNGNISDWDTSNVRYMDSIFYGASLFNQDISGWDVSNIEDVTGIFCEADSFNQDLSKWKVSAGEEASNIFADAPNVNFDISNWDFSKTTFMEYPFYGSGLKRINLLNRENSEIAYVEEPFGDTHPDFVGFVKFSEFTWENMPYDYWVSEDGKPFVKESTKGTNKTFKEGLKYVLEKRQITPHLEIGDYEGKYTGKAITLDDISHSCKDIVGYEIEGGGTWSLDLNGYNGIDSGTYTVLVTFTPNDTDKYRTVTKEVEITMPKSENEGEEVIGTGNPSGRTITNAEIADKEAAQAGTGLPFSDVKETDWFYAGVKESFDKGLLLGTSADKFSPYMDVTRGMMVTVLYRINNEPIEKIIDTYPDVVKDAYYEKAVSWGTTNKVVKGYGTEYKPEKHITRQEMIAMLYRYYNSKKKDTASADVKSLEAFTDRSEVLDYAVNPMAWAVSNKLIVGRTKDTLAPKGELTRAELAVILQRFAKMMK